MTKIGKSLLGIKFAPLIVFLFGFSIAQAKVSVDALVDRNELGLGDNLTLTVQVTSNDNVDVGEPRIPDLSGFELMNSGTSQSTTSKLVQGPHGMQFDTVRNMNFQYVLSAVKKGKQSIGAFEVVVDGTVYRTKPILITVGEVHAQPQQRGRGQQRAQPGYPNGLPPDFDDPTDDVDQMFNQLLQRHFGQGGNQGGGQGGGVNPPPGRGGSHTIPDMNPNEAFMITAEPDKSEVYDGEQITVNWYVYTRGLMETFDQVKFPDLKGFWREIIQEIPSLVFQQEVVNGIAYKRALIASHALFPIKAGTSVIDEFKIKSRVRLPTGGFGGYGPSYEYTKSSKRIEIKVKPLPVEGRPKDFTGAVGTFSITSRVDGESFPANQPFSLKIRIDGYGNAKTVDMPPLELPPGLELYSKRDESKFFKDGRSFKEWEVLIIPRQEGNFAIPSISFSMFDPAQKKYLTKSANAINIKVTPSATSNASSTSYMGADKKSDAGGGSSTNATTAKNVLPDVIVTPEISQPFEIPIYAWIIVYIGVIAALLLKAKKEIGFGERKKTLEQLLKARMKKLAAIEKSGDWRATGAELMNVFYFVLGEVSGLGGATSELNKIFDQAPPSLRREMGDELSQLLERLQVLSFAPEAVVGKMKESAELKKIIDETQKTLMKAIAKSGKSNA